MKSSCLFNRQFQPRSAQVAKLVDALCSGRSVRKDVLVRIQFWALRHLLGAFFYWCKSDGKSRLHFLELQLEQVSVTMALANLGNRSFTTQYLYSCFVKHFSDLRLFM